MHKIPLLIIRGLFPWAATKHHPEALSLSLPVVLMQIILCRLTEEEKKAKHTVH